MKIAAQSGMEGFCSEDLVRFRSDGFVIARGMVDDAQRSALLDAARADLAAAASSRIRRPGESRGPADPRACPPLDEALSDSLDAGLRRHDAEGDGSRLRACPPLDEALSDSLDAGLRRHDVHGVHLRPEAEGVHSRPEADVQAIEYEAQLHYPGAPASLEAPGGHTARRLLQACARNPLFRDFGVSAPVAVRLHQLMGPDVGLAQAHHNCIMTKQPRYSSVTGWHQDVRYWSFERPELVSVWLALGRETPENGCLSFLPGTHLMHFDRSRLDDALFLREDLPENAALIATRVTPLLEPGDVVFFHCRTFHAAGANHTDQTKYSLVFTYHALDNPALPGTRSAILPSLPL